MLVIADTRNYIDIKYLICIKRLHVKWRCLEGISRTPRGVPKNKMPSASLFQSSIKTYRFKKFPVRFKLVETLLQDMKAFPFSISKE